MSSDIQALEDGLIEALHSLSLDNRSLPSVLRELDGLEVDTVAKLIELNAENVVEAARRSIAAAALSIATEKRADAPTAQALFERSRRLGYATPGERLVATGLFSRMCLNNGTASLAVLELEEALHHARVPTELRKSFEALYDELRAQSLR